ncbi:MAG: hypothetical protein LBN43_06920 [Oscillospiraceae bacterium]|jgi:hypothetical protein|nr:hypothetical protein [Oscillospiraceae bacterium]
MIENVKRNVYISGTIISLKLGECAFITSNGKVTRTSEVIALHGTRNGYTVFETRNSYYYVSGYYTPGTACARYMSQAYA